VYLTYGHDIAIIENEVILMSLPTCKEISSLGQKFLISEGSKSFNVDEIMIKYSRRLSQGTLFFSKCGVKDCINTDVEIHHIRKLGRKKVEGGTISVITKKGKRVSGIGALLSAMNRKQLPLCKKHHLEFENGCFYPLDNEYLSKVLRMKAMLTDTQVKDVFTLGSYLKNANDRTNTSI